MTITIREPGSAITHYIAMMMALIAATPLLIKSVLSESRLNFIAMTVFICSMILLYGASATYHSLNVKGHILRWFRRFDHMMIFILIAGTYTPVCLITLKGRLGYILFAVIWGIALLGILIALCWITCPKWFSSLIYIAMGWTCIGVMKPLWETLPLAAFLWLLTGGLIYTAGGVIYALKLPVFNARFRYFGSHELFHLFVMAGSICHFIFMFFYVI